MERLVKRAWCWLMGHDVRKIKGTTLMGCRRCYQRMGWKQRYRRTV